MQRTAVVTGAGAGLGRAVALTRSPASWRERCWRLYRRRELQELAQLRAIGVDRGLAIDTELADVGDDERTQRLADDVHARFGAIHILVNNAGIIIVRPIAETSIDDYDRVLATNLRGPFLYCRAFLGPMVSRGSGTIINVSSQSGIKGFAGESAYCPSKFGLEGLTRTLALELDGSGVRVVSVSPGAPMHTPMSETTYDDEAARSRWIDPAELKSPPASSSSSPACDEDGISGGRFDAYRVGIDGVDAGRGSEVGRGDPGETRLSSSDGSGSVSLVVVVGVTIIAASSCCCWCRETPPRSFSASTASTAARAKVLRHELGLDRSVTSQYLLFMGHLT